MPDGDANILVRLALAFLAGTALGALYFGGLWLSVQAVRRARHPLLFLAGSTLVRLVVALAGFYVVMGGRLERLAAALAGFLLARTLVVRRVRAGVDFRSPQAGSTGDEPQEHRPVTSREREQPRG